MRSCHQTSLPLLIALALSLGVNALRAGKDTIPPLAVAGPDRSVELGSAVGLRGGASSDPDGEDAALAYSWRQIAGPPVPLQNGSQQVAAFLANVVGEYTFGLTVTDPAGGVATDEVLIVALNGIADVRAGLLARWSFEEGSGPLALDASASAWTGRLEGETSWIDDSIDSSDWSIDFPGGDADHVSLGGIDVPGSALTIALWFNADDFGTSDARFISKATGSNDEEHYWMISTLGDGQLRFRLKAGGSTTTLISDDGVIDAGAWTHVAATYDGAQMRIYRNAGEVAAVGKSGALDTNPDVLAAIGNQPIGTAGGRKAFDGLIDEVRIYNRALSAVELATVMNAEHRVFEDVGFNTWARNRGLFGNALALTSDTDMDGIVLLLEYAFDLDPSRPDRLPPCVQRAAGPTLEFLLPIRHAATDLRFVLQSSRNHTDWTNAIHYQAIGNGVNRVRLDGGPAASSVAQDGESSTFTESFPMDSRRLLRIAVER